MVSPYNGVFTPSPSHQDLVTKMVEYNYAQNIGLVKSVCGSIGLDYTLEARLVSYKIN